MQRERIDWDASESFGNFSILSHLSYFQGDYTLLDIGEPWQKTREKVEKVGREKRGGSAFSRVILCSRYASVTYKCRDAVRFAGAQQARCKRGWFRVDSGRIQCIETRDEKAFRFLNIFQLKSRSFVTLGPARVHSTPCTLHPAPCTLHRSHLSLSLSSSLFSLILASRDSIFTSVLPRSQPRRNQLLLLLLFAFHQRSDDPFLLLSCSQLSSAFPHFLPLSLSSLVSPAITPLFFFFFSTELEINIDIRVHSFLAL